MIIVRDRQGQNYKRNNNNKKKELISSKKIRKTLKLQAVLEGPSPGLTATLGSQ